MSTDLFELLAKPNEREDLQAVKAVETSQGLKAI